MYRHGGDVYSKKIELDFSVNINPLGVPRKVYAAVADSLMKLECYPEYSANRLKVRLAEALSINPNNILLSAGASQAFLAIVQASGFETATIFSPGFFGYEYAISSQNIAVNYENVDSLFSEEYDAANEYSDVIFIANPNNPNGKHIDKSYLCSLLAKAKEREILVVIDECFLPLAGLEADSMIYGDFDNVIVVRSFTKTYAIPGIRLGYLFTKNEDLLKKIQFQLPEWNISEMAIEAGLAALEECEYLELAVALIKEEREYLSKELTRLGFEVFDSDVNFLMLKASFDLYERLLAKGILIRDCSNFRGLSQGYYRIAVKKHEDNEKLIKALEQIKNE